MGTKESRRSRGKIMMVDDDQDTREMIELMLQKEGFETAAAKDGADFLEKVDLFHPDIVTLDVLMPGLSIEEILDELQYKKSNPKIILLTVVRFTNEEKKILSMDNIVDYVTKPFDMDVLIKTIKKHVE
jgi:DNA-binding response OmpR family regulator